MKVLLLGNNDVGLYNFRRELIEKLIDEHYDVSIVVPGGPKVKEFLRMGCKYYQVEIDRRGMNPLKDLLVIKNYVSLFKRIKPDVVITYTIKPNIYGGIIRRIQKKPYISNITGLGSSIENGGLNSHFILFLYKIALKKADCLFFQNENNRNKMLEHNIKAKKIRMICGSGVNLKQYPYLAFPDKSSPIILSYIGRIMKDKGVEELFEAAIQVKKQYPGIIFQIAGEYEEDYRARLDELDSTGIIRYLGYRDDIQLVIKESSAIILPSYHEGMSNVLLEAAACGRPVIASNINGCKEIFDENLSGIGFTPHSTEELTKAILKFINIPYQEKMIMGINGRKKIEREFDRTQVIQAYLEEINELCGK